MTVVDGQRLCLKVIIFFGLLQPLWHKVLDEAPRYDGHVLTGMSRLGLGFAGGHLQPVRDLQDFWSLASFISPLVSKV